ncbi:hypothetical protein [Mesorhizobium cantuariense]|uniref:ABC transporter permease n=1 Tax=Mesorhizobium cantuariense TaxID=1300275 RepID=A0ABV7MX13_9HYPH
MNTFFEVHTSRLLKAWREWAPFLSICLAALLGCIWTVYLPIVGLRYLLGY